MSSITLEDAQAQLPQLIEQLKPGEGIVITRDDKPVAAATRRHLDDSHSGHVGGRWKHVPALSDERDHAEDRTHHVQRLGARRVLEGVLARSAPDRAVAPSRRPTQPHRCVPGRRAAVRAPMGGSVVTEKRSQ